MLPLQQEANPPDSLLAPPPVPQCLAAEEDSHHPLPPHTRPLEYSSGDVLVEAESRPQANSVQHWYYHALLGSYATGHEEMSEKAKRHLASVRCKFAYGNEGEEENRLKLRYHSPAGRRHISLVEACKSSLQRQNQNGDLLRPNKSKKTTVKPPPPPMFKQLLLLPPSRPLPPPSPPMGGSLLLSGSEHEFSASIAMVNHLDFKSEAFDRFVQYQRSLGVEPRSGAGRSRGQGEAPCKKKKQRSLPSPSNPPPKKTTFSRLIDSNVVPDMSKVVYRLKSREDPMKEGWISSSGIKCSCCHQLFTLSGFEGHAGSSYHRPSANIFLEDGRSLSECQEQVLSIEPCGTSKEVQNDRKSTAPDKERGIAKEDPNDRICPKSNKPRAGAKQAQIDHTHTSSSMSNKQCGSAEDDQNVHTCSICHYGGELLSCDQCPFSFHMNCIGLVDTPDGKWFCPLCCCRICRKREVNGIFDANMVNSLLRCVQCQHRYHGCCLRKKGSVCQESYDGENWFCGNVCEKIFMFLDNQVGKKVSVGSHLSWKLVRSNNYYGRDLGESDTETLTEKYSNPRASVGVTRECPEPVQEAYKGRDLIENVVFSGCSRLKCLNLKGFYSMLLEENKELICLATIRIHGEKVAEVPLVGNRLQYLRPEMPLILMNEIEKMLTQLGVERVVLPATPGAINTWTASFGFSEMNDHQRLEFWDYNFLDFPGAVICQKLLTSGDPSVESKRLKRNSGEGTHFGGDTPVSEVFQPGQVEEIEFMDQTVMPDATVSGKSNYVSNDQAVPTVMVPSTTLSHMESQRNVTEHYKYCKWRQMQQTVSESERYKYYRRRSKQQRASESEMCLALCFNSQSNVDEHYKCNKRLPE